MKIYHTLIIIALACTSCSLDETPRSELPESAAYTSKETLYLNTVATLYNYIGGYEDGQGLQGTNRGVYDLQTFGSDEAMIPLRGGDWYDGGLWQDMYKHSWTAGHDLMKNSWLYLYKVITLCNRSLETLNTYKDLAGDENHLAWTSEVRALRAMYYWYLIDLFGDVPLVTNSSVSMNEVKREKRAEIFKFCEEELLSVVNFLSYENSTREGDYYGRITQSVAFFILAKLMLGSEVYTGVPRWDDCISFCDELEYLNFELEPIYSANFLVYNQNSKENIFTIPMNKHLFSNQQQNITRSLHYRHAAAYGYNGENGACATLKTLQVFGYPDELDPRFLDCYHYTYVYAPSGIPVTDRTGNHLKYEPEKVQLDLSGSPYVETAGARMFKYEFDKNAIKDGKLVDNDIVLFRYADVLLMRAEAKVRLGQDGSADFNAVRSRAGAKERECTLDNILDERLLELCWEGWRRQDLIRFNKYKSLYEGPDAIDESDGHTTVFPIPADVRALNSNLTQNPGY
ncbi:MAG: RagB/SusD family nutrient uptake outer membrane protein [Muribaculaceae bacterium]|nr:RagB/SusD family nutrient uptake outer membrane protein [Muribaculaceae bacterium]